MQLLDSGRFRLGRESLRRTLRARANRRESQKATERGDIAARPRRGIASRPNRRHFRRGPSIDAALAPSATLSGQGSPRRAGSGHEAPEVAVSPW